MHLQRLIGREGLYLRTGREGGVQGSRQRDLTRQRGGGDDRKLDARSVRRAEQETLSHGEVRIRVQGQDIGVGGIGERAQAAVKVNGDPPVREARRADVEINATRRSEPWRE